MAFQTPSFLTVTGTGMISIYQIFSAEVSMIACLIIMKSLDPLRAKKIFIRKKLGHTAVSAIKASSVTL